MVKDLSGKNNPFYGRKHSTETRALMSKLKKGKSLEEQFGFEKAQKIKAKLSIKSSRPRPSEQGEKHRCWKGGKQIYFHHVARRNMEQKLGRRLKGKETIHHIDSNPQNNKIDNLYLFNNNSVHMKYHCELRRIVKEMIK